MSDSTEQPTKQTFTGSCHCGFIRYQAAISLPSSPTQPTAGRCNCTTCLKSGFTGIQIPFEDFTLLSPASKDQLSDYHRSNLHKYFCKTCGIQTHEEGAYEFEGQKHPFFCLNILSLDQPQKGLELSRFKIKYWDGKNDNWGAGSKEEPWLGGSI